MPWHDPAEDLDHDHASAAAGARRVWRWRGIRGLLLLTIVAGRHHRAEQGTDAGDGVNRRDALPPHRRRRLTPSDPTIYKRRYVFTLNRTFVAVQDQAIADSLGTRTSTIQTLAVAEALRNRWNGATPSSVSLTFLPDGITNALSSLFSSKR